MCVMLNKKGVTLSIIMEGQSLNYNESPLTVSELKKLTRGNGIVSTYSSRQSLGYEIRKAGDEVFGWNLNVVTCKNRVMQFDPKKTIADSEEMDLFGYMMTAEGKGNTKTRNAVVRLSNAISLEPYKGDLEFANNMGLAKRIGADTMPYSVEQHKSYYAYTITIDLNRVGIDGDIELDNETKVKRLNQLLDILRHLKRDIRGRREKLSPLFVVGGVYTNSNPYFDGMLDLENTKKGFNINTKRLISALNARELGADRRVKESTLIGFVDGVFNNVSDLEATVGADKLVSIDDFFDALKSEIKAQFGVK